MTSGPRSLQTTTLCLGLRWFIIDVRRVLEEEDNGVDPAVSMMYFDKSAIM